MATATPNPPAVVSQPTILLVEDQERAARGLEELLGLEGFRVTVAKDGPSGLAAAETIPVDAIVLDVMLPGMSGFDVCRRLRTTERTSQIPIVMLTGLSDTPSKLRSFEIGADDYLVKPVPARELAARLRKLIAGRAANAHQIHAQRLAAISEIAAAVAHEINNPLTSAIGTIDLVLLRDDLPTAIRRDIVSSRQQLWRIASVLAELTDVADRSVPYVGADKMIALGPDTNA